MIDLENCRITGLTLISGLTPISVLGRFELVTRTLVKLIIISPFVLTLSANTAAQTADFKIKGVGIGTSYQTVFRQLGKPSSSRKGGINPCGGNKQVMDYSGLTISFDEDESKQSIVVFIEVTSPKWEIAPGISVGSSLQTIQSKFGQSNQVAKKTGFDTVTYLDGDGAIIFYFRNKKLIKATRDLNLC